MSLKALRRCFFAVVVVLGALVLTPGMAQASVAAGGTPSFPSTVTVGTTGLPASVTVTNLNTPLNDLDPNTVCNFGNASPPCAPGEQGIALEPSCGVVAGGDCMVPDPGVFQLAPFGFGRAGTFCGGMLFSITLIDPVFGTVTFTPLGPPVVLPFAGASCVIDFTFDVLKSPTFDYLPGVPGLQTVQTTRHTQFDPGIGSAALTTSSNGVTVLLAQPTIATTASPTIVLGGGSLSDTATVSGRVNPQAGATVTFELFGPNNPTCASTPIFVNVVPYPVAGGPVTSSAFTPTSAGTYRWVASYSGDVNNTPVAGACNDANETTVVDPAAPVISTTASPTMPMGGGFLSDTAVVSGRVNPQAGATVTFQLFAPGDVTCVFAFFTSTTPYPVAGGPVTSAGITPGQAGTYRWIASYSGDANNAPVTGACNDANEATVVTPATPTIATTASPTTTLGAGTLTDTAVVSGRVNPQAGATITFSLYGPGDVTCSGAPFFTASGVAYPVAGGPVTSPAFTPTTAGTYRWIASYSGDVNNAPVTGACNDANESVVVNAATPTIATAASADIVLGAGQLTDNATVSGLVNPLVGATVDFRLYGPNDATCSGTPIFQNLSVPYPVAGGAVTSAAFTPAQAGTYRWIASYSGDANNAPVTGACNAANETAVVSQATPTIVTTASTDMVLGGGQLSDTAAVSGRVNPVVGAIVDFRLYGPNDATCSGTPVFESLNVAYPVAGGSVGSLGFTPTQAGTYRWRAFYSGDANNTPASGACNAANETVVVARAAPTIATTASGDIVVGAGQLTDTATVSGRVNPVVGATVDFRLYGPSDATCSGTPVFESLTVALSAGGTAASGAFTPTQAGTYRWRAFYSGDANNEPVSGPCNAANESVNVVAPQSTPTDPTTTTTARVGNELPRTGSDPNALVYAGFACVLCGIALVGSARRRFVVAVR